MNTARLEGKVAMVTGGCGVLGAAIADTLSSNGAKVVLADLDATSRTGTSEHFPVDMNVGSEESVAQGFASVDKQYGRLDVLVNAAGYEQSEPVEAMTSSNWNNMLNVHLTGTFYCCKEGFLRMQRQRSGKIINISSQLAYKGAANLAHYCAAKAGTLGFTRAFAREAIAANVFVNTVAPGPVDSPVLRACGEEFIERKLMEMPIGRLGTPPEIAGTVLMLASVDGEFYVGQTLCPSGGDVML
ncbi:MAG TPA: SDR family oxidoreductase [Segeticoccus sp.]|uniref:SDR family NAD(P)-dependent oxidoreductase n=1 Tax=Segeticoccus sp. TaxID=2706531 RepID=UPI002D811307|nr:SDR family oxidoreductase [Segeticoccus sp.]HET8600744.1 SDR family oxidoreductase [Segeticoccus sp.]